MVPLVNVYIAQIYGVKNLYENAPHAVIRRKEFQITLKHRRGQIWNVYSFPPSRWQAKARRKSSTRNDLNRLGVYLVVDFAILFVTLGTVKICLERTIRQLYKTRRSFMALSCHRTAICRT